MAKKKNPFEGRWRIVSLSAWEDDFLDEEVEAYIEIADKGWGAFHFGNVQGQMDFDLALGNRPSAVVLVLEIRATRMSKKHLQLAIVDAIHQQASTDTGH